jgi:hypothetical protein
MTDDDDLRDDFGDELTALLRDRARETESLDAVGVTHRARVRRLRRWSVTATVAAAVVVVLVGVLASGGGGRTVRIEEPPTPTTTVSPGHKIVSYHGVHVEVPASWPVVDGMHTQFCRGPFSDTPTAYLGPNDNGPPSCPPTLPGLMLHRDGVWLDSSPTPDPDSQAATTASGEPVLETPRERGTALRFVWLRGVSIEIGLGGDPSIAQAIFDSIGYTEGAPDTPRSGVCARSPVPKTMPTPERLTSRIENVNVTLDPPASSDQPSVRAEEVWRPPNPRANFERYRMLLTRFTSVYPPEGRNVLAWVIYASPITRIVGCGGYSVHAFDAKTGAGLGQIAYGQGP